MLAVRRWNLNPEKNRLSRGADRAQFARPEYEPFWTIVMAHGFTPAGYEWARTGCIFKRRGCDDWRGDRPFPPCC
ncbi:hypothetical protein C9E81_15585 [Paracoccus alkanivorans]|uniref:Uncharacterized protein n=1 Tax=Paracoccus alkanivorans TaxID=2116655 RepID=A0A3M0M7M9_9RHOB|nr:hypothetical protein C9E81_15585 [Paracoccus alkanivorans]